MVGLQGPFQLSAPSVSELISGAMADWHLPRWRHILHAPLGSLEGTLIIIMWLSNMLFWSLPSQALPNPWPTPPEPLPQPFQNPSPTPLSNPPRSQISKISFETSSTVSRESQVVEAQNAQHTTQQTTRSHYNTDWKDRAHWLNLFAAESGRSLLDRFLSAILTCRDPYYK